MPEPSDKKKVEPKMVRESDLLAIKAERDKLKEKLAVTQGEVSKLTSALQIAKTDADDEDEVIKVKEALLAQAEEIEKDRVKFSEEVTSFNVREKGSRVQALASKYEIDAGELEGAEDPEKRAMEIALERQASKKEVSSAENVVESHTAGGLVRKQIKDQTNAEFEETEKRLKAEWLAKAGK